MTAEKSTTMLKIFLVLAFILNEILHGSVSFMIQLIRCLQIVLHLPFITEVVPGNVTMIYGVLIPIAMFDVLENDEFNY